MDQQSYVSLFKKRIEYYENSTTNKKGLYFQFYTELVKMYELYGLKTCLLYQVGKFFESYGFEDEYGTFGNYKDIAKLTLLKIVYGDRQATYSSPQYIGFQTEFEEKYIDVLVRNGYTVAVYVQATLKNKGSIQGEGENIFNKENGVRILRDIISPATYVDSSLNYSSPVSKNIISIYIEGINSKSELEKFQFICGCSIIDVSTGDTLITELSNVVSSNNSSNKNITDKKIIDDIYRLFSIFKPLEIIIYYKSIKFTTLPILFFKNYIGELFSSEKCICLDISSENSKKYCEEPHQILILGKSYKCGSNNIFDFLGITKFYFGTIALVTLIDYLNEQRNFLIKNLKVPRIYDSQNRLILENDALYQLSIVSKNNNTKSLIDIINKTSTPMGYRHLYDILTKPFTDPQIIKNRLDCISFFINLKTNNLEDFTNIVTTLKKVGDIQRLQRRIFFKNLKIEELYKLHLYYEYIIKVLNILILKKNKPTLLKINKNFISQFKLFIKEYLKFFEKDEFSTIKKGVNKEFDETQAKLEINKALINEIYNFLRDIITDTKMKTYIKLGNEGTGKIKITVTKTVINQIKKLTLPPKYSDNKNDDYIEFIAKGNTYKVKSISLKNANRNILILEEELKKQKKAIYDSLLIKLSEYEETLNELCDFIALIDISISGAICALEYGYNRPMIVDENNNGVSLETPLEPSYFNVKKIRHPIIERLIKERYVTNDLELSPDKSMLLYGINACGKSSLMRACALNIIMAQSGMYVPSEYFEIKPYFNIFTRIDVIESFYYSRFEMECLDMKSIYNRSGPNTFVLLDELVSSTELNSALSISYAMCYFLKEFKATFIFATHLHSLYTLIENNKLNIDIYHLSIETTIEGNVIYTRKLQKGQTDNLYGIEVAKNIIGADTPFIKEAYKIRNLLVNPIQPKKTKYNKNILLVECDICGSKENLELHHILEQHTATKDNLVSNEKGEVTSKNDLSNHCVLCKGCHIKNHNSDEKIDGWKKDIKSGEFILVKK